MSQSSLKLPTLNEVKKAIARKSYLDYVIYTHQGRYKRAPHIEYIGNIIQKAIDKKQRMRDGEIPTENQYS
ncbi:hypothetical protein SAMN05878482_10423 [Peribacillus simplex]|uniref:Uncharacterized protein n=1 Tax=Peribacillus simplex TaxID=1478 RepID=A0A9X8R9V5_9BACI|nr:hypothetical protein SAMN05878482_10423 [Peribacillus simplex]